MMTRTEKYFDHVNISLHTSNMRSYHLTSQKLSRPGGTSHYLLITKYNTILSYQLRFHLFVQQSSNVNNMCYPDLTHMSLK